MVKLNTSNFVSFFFLQTKSIFFFSSNDGNYFLDTCKMFRKQFGYTPIAKFFNLLFDIVLEERVHLICCKQILLLIRYILFLVYWNITPTETETRKFRIMVRNRAWMLFILIILASLFLSFLGGILFYKFHLTSDTLVKYAMTLGTISSILMIVQWAPQIYTTWRIKVCKKKKKPEKSVSIIFSLLTLMQFISLKDL